MHTSSFGMDWRTWSNSLTVAGDITRSTDSMISKYPLVPIALSVNDRSIVHGARIYSKTTSQLLMMIDDENINSLLNERVTL